MGIILASGSPRRRELLELIGLDFKIMPAVGEEKPHGETPDARVRGLAMQKAREVADKCDRDDIVIAADTLVHFDGRDLGKPKDECDALNMLMSLSGKTHEVYTGVAVICGETAENFSECTRVTFKKFSESEATHYIATGEPMDKAGAYGAQGLGSVLVSGIDGDFFNVMGLPVCHLCETLKKFGIEVL